LLTEKWLSNHTHIKKMVEAYPEAIRRLTVEGADQDYNASQFGGDQAKKEFRDLNVTSFASLSAGVRRAALSVQNPCYVCALLSSYTAATKVSTRCVALVKAVNDALPGEGSSFNCEKVKDFTREDLETPSLDVAYWDKASRYQTNLEEDLNGGVTGLILGSINKLRDHLKIFAEFHAAHPGDADRLKRDIQSVGQSCGSGVSLRRVE
jgi:hypothetical protein